MTKCIKYNSVISVHQYKNKLYEWYMFFIIHNMVGRRSTIQHAVVFEIHYNQMVNI